MFFLFKLFIKNINIVVWCNVQAHFYLLFEDVFSGKYFYVHLDS